MGRKIETEPFDENDLRRELEDKIDKKISEKQAALLAAFVGAILAYLFFYQTSCTRYQNRQPQHANY